MQKFIDPRLLDRLRVGPLAAYLDTYLERIEHAGFLPSSVPMQIYAIARFSNWLHAQQINLQLMDEGTIQQFLKRDLDISHSGESGSLRRLSTWRDAYRRSPVGRFQPCQSFSPLARCSVS